MPHVVSINALYFHSKYLRATKALARLRVCASSSEPSLLALCFYYMISFYINILLFTAAEVGSSQVVTSVVEDERRHAALYLDKLEEKMKTHNVKS